MKKFELLCLIWWNPPLALSLSLVAAFIGLDQSGSESVCFIDYPREDLMMVRNYFRISCGIAVCRFGSAQGYRHDKSLRNAACCLTRVWIESDCVCADMKFEQDFRDLVCIAWPLQINNMWCGWAWVARPCMCWFGPVPHQFRKYMTRRRNWPKSRHLKVFIFSLIHHSAQHVLPPCWPFVLRDRCFVKGLVCTFEKYKQNTICLWLYDSLPIVCKPHKTYGLWRQPPSNFRQIHTELLQQCVSIYLIS